MSSTRTKPKSDSKTAWKNRSDVGPHTAVFPSGATLTFTIPNQSSAALYGLMSDRLRRTAKLCAAHPEGPEGYMADIVSMAMVSAERAEIVEHAIDDGIALQHLLVAHMLVSPQVTADEVAEGVFPELDVRMLLEFAERRRNTDAAGNKIGVIVLRDYATFRRVSEGAESPGVGGTVGRPDGDDVPDPDGDDV